MVTFILSVLSGIISWDWNISAILGIKSENWIPGRHYLDGRLKEYWRENTFE
jgi:hypothetical protein